MKTLRTLFSAMMLVFAAAACQNADVDGNANFAKKGNGDLSTLTVKIAKDATRLGFESGETNLKRQFVVDDELIGCTKVDGVYKNFAYKVQNIDDSGAETVVTLVKTAGDENIPSAAEGTVLHFIYAPGHECTAITEEGTLELDLKSQTEGHIPAVMTASGIVESDNTVTLNFNNIAAVVEIDPLQFSFEQVGTTPYTFTSARIAGATTKGTISVVGDKSLDFVPGEAGTATVSVANTEMPWDNESKVYLALLPTKNAELTVSIRSLSFGEEKGNFSMAPFEASINENGYYRIAGAKDFGFDAVAQTTVGGTTVKYGALSRAFAAANAAEEPCTLKILKDISSSTAYTILNEKAQKITIDLNDFIITSSKSPAYTVSSDVDVVDGPKGEGGITATAGQVFLCSSDNVTLNISGGTFRGCATYGTIRFYGGPGSVLNLSGNTKIYATGKDNKGVNMGSKTTATAAKAFISGNVYVESEGAEAFKNQYGETTINGGTFVGVQAALTGTYATQKMYINDGYFFGTDAELPVVQGAGLTVTGGWFNKAPEAIFIALNHIANPDTKNVDGKDYLFQVIEYVPVNNIVEVNGTGYLDFDLAFTDAMAANEDVTIKLLDNIKVEGARDFTNANGKTVTLDLNGFDFTSSAQKSHFVTTTGTLNIIDSSAGEAGTLSSNGYRVISLGSEGVVNVSRINIRSTRTSAGGYTGADSSMVVISGVEGAANAKMTLNDGATIGNNIKSFKIFYLGFGTLEINEAKLFAGNETDGAYNLIYVANKGSVLTINDGASFRTYGSTGILRPASKSATITINGGYFYGETIFAAGTNSYMTAFLLNGGYYSSDITQIEAFATYGRYGDGLSFQVANPVATYDWDGTILNYGYFVGPSIIK